MQMPDAKGPLKGNRWSGNGHSWSSGLLPAVASSVGLGCGVRGLAKPHSMDGISVIV